MQGASGMFSVMIGFVYTPVFAVLLSLNSIKIGNGFEVKIDNQGVNIKRKVNESLSLNCSLTNNNNTAESLVWKKDGKSRYPTISSEQWSVIRIKYTTRSDAGYYECIAKNKEEKREAYVYVNIQGKPIIFKSGEPRLFTRSPARVPLGGNPPKLLCTATGWPGPRFQWFKDGKEIKSGSYFIISPSENGKSLQILPTLKTPVGKYTCEASNIYGRDNHTIGVEVVDSTIRDPVITPDKYIIHSYPGQSNLLACNGENIRIEDADTTWLFNGKDLKDEINNSSRLNSNTDYYDQKVGGEKRVRMTLILNKTKIEDAGNYTCVITVNDDTYSKTIELTIQTKAKGPSGGREQGRLTTSQLTALTIGLLLLIIVVLALVIYFIKKRVELQYPQIPKGPFKYGAFITYNSQDFGWVKANLLPLLEKNDIEVCIHYRNFEPGVAIHQNMVNSVYSSRVVIVVMSNNYLKSKFCRAELDYAIHRAIEEYGSNPLIILRIDPAIKKSKLPKEIKNKTYLDFVSNVEKATWEKRLLKHIALQGMDENENEGDGDKDQVNDALINQEDEKKTCLV